MSDPCLLAINLVNHREMLAQTQMYPTAQSDDAGISFNKSTATNCQRLPSNHFTSSLEISPPEFGQQQTTSRSVDLFAQAKEATSDIVEQTYNTEATETASYYYNLGTKLADQGKYDEAIAAYRKAIELNSSHAFAYNNLGAALVNTGRYEEALDVIQQSLALNPNNSAAYNNLGIALGRLGQHDEEISAYLRAIELNPNNSSAYVNLGFALSQSGDDDRAISAYQQAIALGFNDSGVFYNLASTLHRKERYDEAIRAYRAILALEPNTAFDASANYEIGNILAAQGKHEEAIAAYQRVNELYPEDRHALNKLAYSLVELRRYAEAAKMYKRLIELEPGNAVFHTNFGLALDNQGHLDEAISAYSRAIELDPSYAMAYAALGHTLAAQEQYDRAISAYQKATRLEPKNASFYYGLGHSFDAYKKYNEAIAAYLKATEILPNYADVYLNLGLTYEKTNRPKEAANSFETALKIYEHEKDLMGQVKAFNNLGNAYTELSKAQSLSDIKSKQIYYQKALNAHRQALEIYHQVGSVPPLFEVMTLVNIGRIYNNLDEYQNSIATSNKALQLIQKERNSPAIKVTSTSRDDQFQEFAQDIRNYLGIDGLAGMAFLNLGESFRLLGDDQQALYAYEISRRLFRSVQAQQDNPEDSQIFSFFESLILFSNSMIYKDLGRTQKVVDLSRLSITNASNMEFPQAAIFFQLFQTMAYKNGIELLEQLRPASSTGVEGEAMWHMSRGYIYNESKDYSQALREYQIALQKLKDSDNLLLRASALRDTSSVLLAMERFAQALDMSIQALNLAQQANHPLLKADVLKWLGEVHTQLGNYESAVRSYTEASQIIRALNDPAGLANAYFGMAKTERSRGNIEKAIDLVETAIGIIESNPQSGSSGQVWIERGGLVEITNAPQPITITAPNPESNRNLVSYFRSKQQYFDFYIELLMQMHRNAPQAGYDLQALQANERARTCSLQTLLAESNQRNKRESQVHSSDLSCSNPDQRLNLSEIQSALDDRTTLLEYVLGEEHSYVWVITKTDVSHYELPKRADIESVAREFYQTLTDPKWRDQANRIEQVGSNLSQLILKPILSELKHQRLLIVGDGILQYIPFSVLPDPRFTPSSDARGFEIIQPLLVNHEVINLPSASTLLTIQPSQGKLVSTIDSLAIFANPVFNREDSRLEPLLAGLSPQSQSQSYLGLLNEIPNAVNDSDSSLDPPESIYSRLSGTQEEASEIIRQVLNVNPEANIRQFIGFDANYQAAISPKLKEYQIVHFATHGLLSNNDPTESGMVLSTINELGMLQRGLLSAADTYSMQLSADLVVLSGCRTGLSANADSDDEAIAEGLFGLTGGFMNAGAQRVLVSLWSVNDESTKEFMQRFYQNMLNPYLNLTPSEALRKTQLLMWNELRWQEPYKWAAFSMHGNWK